MLCLIFAVLIGFVVPGDALKASDCRCRLKSNEKIGYGKMSPESEYPWHTSLGYLMDYAYNVTDPTERNELLRNTF